MASGGYHSINNNETLNFYAPWFVNIHDIAVHRQNFFVLNFQLEETGESTEEKSKANCLCM